jgi:sec-independent protein translocase protein TatB
MFFGMSGTELMIVLLVALLVLGPSKLPGLARTLGKTMRDFKRATQDIRDSVEIEFYHMDQPTESLPPSEKTTPSTSLADSSTAKQPSSLENSATTSRQSKI